MLVGYVWSIIGYLFGGGGGGGLGDDTQSLNQKYLLLFT